MSTPGQFILNTINHITTLELQDDEIVNNKYSGIGTGENYLGSLLKVGVEGKNTDKKLNLVVKTGPDDSKLRYLLPINNMFEREAHCYNRVFPKFEQFEKENNLQNGFKYAKCYYASSEDTKEIIVMEDVIDKGFVMTKRSTPFDIDHVRVVIKEKAYFHAISFAMKLKKPREYEELIRVLKPSMDVGFFFSIMKESWNQLIDLLQDENSKEQFVKALPSFTGRLVDCGDFESSSPYNVICHGDSWSNNLMFKYENGIPVEMMMIDWQLSRVISPLCDLSLVLFLNTNAEVRKSHYEECIELYYAQLEKRLGEFNCDIEDCFPKNVFEEHIKKYSIYGLCKGVTASSFLYDDQGLDVAGLDSEKADFKHSIMSIKHANDIVDDFVRLDLL